MIELVSAILNASRGVRLMAHDQATKCQMKAVDLAVLLRGFTGKLRRRLHEQSNAGALTPSQAAVILRLESDGAQTTSALARAETMRPQSMGAIVSALQAQGLIEGSPDPGDGRQVILKLTDRCRTWLAEGRSARQDWLADRIETVLTAEDQAQLSAAIPLLKRLIEP